MQVRVQSAGRVMPEDRADHVARIPVRILMVFPNPCGREHLQMAHGNLNGFIMRLDNPFIISNQCGNRNRFWRRYSEIIKYPTIGRFMNIAILVHADAFGIKPWCQLLP